MRKEDLENKLKKGKINKIPKDMDKKIDDLLKNIDKKAYQRKKKGYKKIAMVAGIVLALGMGSTGAVALTNYEVKEKLYDIFGFEESFERYSKSLNEEIIKDGIGIMITDVLTDGESIYISYEVTGMSEEMWTGNYYFIEEGESQSKEALSNGLVYMKENGEKSKVIYQFRLNRKNEMNQIYKDEIKFKVKFIDGQKEKVINNWEFKFNISNENMIKDIKVYEINKNVGKGFVEKIIITPLNIYVKGKGDLNIDIKDTRGNIERCIIGNGINVENGGECEFQFENKFTEERLSIIEIDEVQADSKKEKEISVEVGEKGFKQIGNYGIEIIDIKNENGKMVIKYKGKDINNLYFNISSEHHPYFETKERLIDKETRELILLNGTLEKGNIYKFTHFDKSDTKYGEEIIIE